MPGGDIRRCYTDTPPPTVVCPAGTDRAGQPMPQGDILGFAPPLCLTKNEADIVVKAAADAITSVLGSK